jgi:hypothetical protein
MPAIAAARRRVSVGRIIDGDFPGTAAVHDVAAGYAKGVSAGSRVYQDISSRN